MKKKLIPFIAAAFLALLAGANTAFAQSFSLDDNPAAPLASPPSIKIPPGIGAENEFGPAPPAPPLAPSPSIPAGVPAQGDATMFTGGIPGPAIAPTGIGYIDAFSTNHAGLGENDPIKILFSIDRLPDGAPGSAALAQTLLSQQMGDIFTSTAIFSSPAAFAGFLPAGAGWVGFLPTAGSAPLGSNVLTYDESAFGLTTGAGIVGPGAFGGIVGPGTHDNLDAFDLAPLGPGPFFPGDSFFSVNPDQAAVMGAAASDIFIVPAGTAAPAPFAPAGTIGLLPTDSIDALVMFDRGTPGSLDPGADFALFSLANGSAATMTIPGLFPNDVFFTDFTGVFATYALFSDVGLSAGLWPTGPGGGHNIDALEIIPEPSAGALVLLAAGALAARRRRRAA